MFKTKYIGIFLIVIAGITFLTLWYKNRSGAGIPIVFSEKSMLNFLWQNYKANYIERDTGRTLDKQQDDITTSEGQSYSMMRAVLEDDQITFDSVYKWTQENLGRDEDHLFSWLFGKKPNGKYGVLVDKGGYNTASDADTDIALALIFAYERWHEERYINDAKNIINDIWEKEVVLIRGVPYMSANNLEKFLSTNIIINPSY
ncbi:MAG TPA: glycosyl hydrolase family 8, partial [Candidatus Paceibacterota bacterium]